MHLYLVGFLSKILLECTKTAKNCLQNLRKVSKNLLSIYVTSIYKKLPQKCFEANFF